MTTLDQIVQVNITRDTVVPTQVGFGLANFVSEAARFEARIKEYADIAEVTADPQAGADTLAFATSHFSQQIRPVKLFVTKKGQDLAMQITLSIDADLIAANDVDVTISGDAIATETFASDHDTTWAAVAAAIQGLASVATAAVVDSRNILITGAATGAAITVDVSTVTNGASQATLSDAITAYHDSLLTYTASLVAAEAINNDWYAVATQDKTDAVILEVAAYVQTRVKIYAAASSDVDILNPALATDVASLMKALLYDRTFTLYSATAETTYPEAGWLGGQLPKDPGSITWAFKQIVGTAADDLISAQSNAALDKNANVYTTVGGVNITQDGKVASGEYIDVIRGVDFIQVRIQEEVFSVLASEDKVPFTDLGIGSIENAVRAVLQVAEDTTILTNNPKFTISSPKAVNVSTADKASRTLRNISFEGTLAGAIQTVIISGNVSV